MCMASDVMLMAMCCRTRFVPNNNSRRINILINCGCIGAYCLYMISLCYCATVETFDCKNKVKWFRQLLFQ